MTGRPSRNPDQLAVPSSCATITGISTNMCRAPTFAGLAGDLAQLRRHRHNAGYRGEMLDIGIVDARQLRRGLAGRPLGTESARGR